MLLFLLAQQTEPAPSLSLQEYGAIGILAALLLAAVGVLWRRISAIVDAERARADRLETELLNLNKLISSELSGHLVRATEAMREVAQMLRDRDRDRGGDR